MRVVFDYIGVLSSPRSRNTLVQRKTNKLAILAHVRSMIVTVFILLPIILAHFSVIRENPHLFGMSLQDTSQRIYDALSIFLSVY